MYNDFFTQDFVYAITYEGGFGLPTELENVRNLMYQTREILVQKLPDKRIAYDFCKREYFERKFRMNDFNRYPLPSFDDVLWHPFFEKGYLKTIVFQKRFFATVSLTHAGIYDNVEESLNFIEYFNTCILKEFYNFDAALGYINATFLRYFYPFENEINASISILKHLPLNMAIATPYLEEARKYLPFDRNFNPIPIPQCGLHFPNTTSY